MKEGVPVLELVDATVVKGGVRVLDRVNLTIHAGQHTAIVGPNGSGKSTLINLLTLDDRALADEGEMAPVRVFGQSRWNVFDLRSRLGVVSSDLHQRFVEGNSFGRVTGEDATLSGLFGTRGVLKYVTVTKAMRERAADALARVEATHLVSRTLDQMSTGEARRVLIARALVTEPEAVVLDEPSNGLDLVARHRFMETIARIADAGTAVVLVTHHIDEIIPAVDHVALLAHGRVLHSGSKRTVLTSANLSAAYGAPIVLEEAHGYFHARAASDGRSL